MDHKQLWTVVGGLSAAGGGVLGKKLLHGSWAKLTGKQPPANPEHPEVSWPEAVTYAVLSGAIIGLGRLVARRLAAGQWHRRTGALPPGLQTVD